MKPRLFLDAAKRQMAVSREENRRTAAGRAYYALLLECRDVLTRWGFVAPRSETVHRFVRLHFYTATIPDLVSIGTHLGIISQWRTKADYEMTSPLFAADKVAFEAISKAENALVLLDAIDGNPGLRTAAIADIRSRWP